MNSVSRFFLLLSLFTSPFSSAQYESRLPAREWTDSVFNTLSNDERIAQLIVIRAHSNLGSDHVEKVTDNIKNYNVGALCFFQGGPVRQANLTNYYQDIAKTPLLVTTDAEWGLGMRLDSVTKFPYQLTLGALNDPDLIYRMGIAVGEQCKRIGVQVNYAPVVDINNNPANPVIGYRSFGEDKNKVAQFGVAYMKGMQEAGIMACAKHFPGHGDVAVDSHFDLPVVNKTRQELENTELVPFKALFNAGVRSVMIAHLSLPAIDNAANRATSISKKTINGLLRDDMHYQGLTFTDALEMKGVAKYFPGGRIAVEALIAGNDMLCLPESVPETIIAVKKAIRKKKLSWKDINAKVKKVLLAKYQLGLNKHTVIATDSLVDELNAKTDGIRYEVAMRNLTLLRNESDAFPVLPGKRIAYVGIGAIDSTYFGKRLEHDMYADTYYFSYSDSAGRALQIVDSIRQGGYQSIVIGIHNFSLRPANNYTISEAAVNLFSEMQLFNAATFVFGNVLAISNFCTAKNLVACYQDDDITQNTAADLLEGKIVSMGRLPVSVCQFKYGDGIVYGGIKAPLTVNPPIDSVETGKRLAAIDSIAQDGIKRKAYPGCVVLALHKGNILYYKAFGRYKYGPSPAVDLGSIYDLASVTKVTATTMAVMKLYDDGKLDLDKTLGDYLPWVAGSNKANLKLNDVLLHQAGLVSFIPFYRETINAKGLPSRSLFSAELKPGFTTAVAKNLYLRDDWQDTLLKRIAMSPLGPPNKYVYSDNDFIFLGKIVEAISGQSLNEYVDENFYSKMCMASTGFKPLEKFPASRIAPTEEEKTFRRQLLDGYVHDPGAALFGGVAGHAGLFSDAYDLAMIYQMLLDGGEFNGERYLKAETIKYFTSYHSAISRRGFGFDKPEKDNAVRNEPYPCPSASSETFGHTGFTGTCVWVDPRYDLVYVFLSNRVYPSSDNPRLSQLNVRGKIQEAIYYALGVELNNEK
jgi:beta-glucosidase-like glycosyl hydrolase/CubicO group peptidase (beta-lactamase class C family)